MRAAVPVSSQKSKRKDGRKPLLMYVRPDLVVRLKQQALFEDRHAYMVLEQILEEHFQRLKAEQQP